MNTTLTQGDMNYLVFDQNLFNSLFVGGVKKIYRNTMDYSIFRIEEKDDYLSHIDWSVFADRAAARQSFFENPLTILYSFCPYEICGLYASAAFFRDREIPICLASPDRSDPTDIISFSDYSPEQILQLLKSNSFRLSPSRKAQIYEEWDAILQKQSNLRIWRGNRLVNAADDFFDPEIREVLQHEKGAATEAIFSSVQILLRQKYRIGLNAKYLDWRIACVLKQRKEGL